MDDAAALQMVRVFIGFLEASEKEYRLPTFPPPADPGPLYWVQSPVYNSLEVKITGNIGAIVAIANQVAPEFEQRIRARARSGWPYGASLTACRELAEVLATKPHLERVLSGPGPQIDAFHLHPWVGEAAEKLWAGGHYPEAVGRAASRIFDKELPQKLEVPKGRSGVGEAFSRNPPTTGSPRLRFLGLTEGTDDWRSAHDGARFFGMGCEAGIRNLVTHGGRRPDEQVALEMLAALSVLARWIDEAEVLTAVVDDQP